MKKLALVAAAAVAWSGAALADGPDWTYIDLSYLRADSGNEESDGFVLNGSVEFADKYVLDLAYYDGEVGITSSDNVDFDGYTINFGVRPALSDSIDLIADLGYFDIEQDGDGPAGFGDDSGVDGYSTRVGMRAQILDNVDVWAIAVGYYGEADCDNAGAGDSCFAFGTSITDGDDYTELGAVIGGQYQWTERAGVTINHTIDGLFGGDVTQFGIRYTFQ